MGLKESFSRRRSVSAPSGADQKIVRDEKELKEVEEVRHGEDVVRLSKDQVKEVHEGDSPKFRRRTKLVSGALTWMMCTVCQYQRGLLRFFIAAKCNQAGQAQYCQGRS